MHGQAELPSLHHHPPRPCCSQTATMDPQDRTIPSACLAAQMPQGTKIKATEVLLDFEIASYSDLRCFRKRIPKSKMSSRIIRLMLFPKLSFKESIHVQVIFDLLTDKKNRQIGNMSAYKA